MLPGMYARSRSRCASRFFQTDDPSLLSVRRIYGSPEFKPELFGPARWLAGGTSYTIAGGLERGRAARTSYGTTPRPARVTSLVAAAKLVPAGDTASLDIEDYSWSADEKQLLVFTNSQPVWRQNTRGDYWVLDLDQRTAAEAGGAAAKPLDSHVRQVLPDGRRVGYVREFNLYVEDLASGKITQLTSDGSARSSTAPSTGSTKRNWTTGTAGAGVRTARASRSGSWWPTACGTST